MLHAVICGGDNCIVSGEFDKAKEDWFYRMTRLNNMAFMLNIRHHVEASPHGFFKRKIFPPD